MTAKKMQQKTCGEEKNLNASASNHGAVPDEEVRQESSKAAKAALAAQKKTKELKKAAAGAGDPDERQKLMEQAIDAQIEAESFGKTAKYLRSGAFQGLAVGTGLGVAPGATLGAVTGTLVGGVTSTITGGVGGGIGAAAGALHGPIWNLGEVAGKGVRKLTGDLPGWVASDEQKQTLEKMMVQVQEEDMPGGPELQRLQEEGGALTADEGWTKSARDMMPSMGSARKSSEHTKKDGSEQKREANGVQQEKQSPTEGSAQTTDARSRKKTRKKPRKLEVKPSDKYAEDEKSTSGRKKPRKLEVRPENNNTEPTKAHPRKLETRS